MMEDHKKKTIKEATLVIINCLIVVSPYTLSSEWIVMTNARVLHSAKIKFYNNEMYTCLPFAYQRMDCYD